MNTMMLNNPEYLAFLSEVKAKVLSTRIAAASAVNSQLILMYWEIGRGIADRQERLGWGKSVIENLSRDLQEAFPGSRGFSPANLWFMRRLYLEYSSSQFLEQLVQELQNGRIPGLLPLSPVSIESVDSAESAGPQALACTLLARIAWGHHVEILKTVKGGVARIFYISASAQFRWSRNILINQIKGQCYERALTLPKSHNFAKALPDETAARADEMLKAAYDLAFVGAPDPARERELEGRLTAKVQRFMLELGYGFCFIGRQHRITLGDNEYFLDLLFYHRFLRALVVVDIKLGRFQPEFAGKMDFYLNVLNDTQRAPDDIPSIGIILCASKDDLVVEYSLKTKGNPIGVATHQVMPNLPEDLKGKLPTEAELKAVIQSELDAAESAPDETRLIEGPKRRRVGKGSRRRSE